MSNRVNRSSFTSYRRWPRKRKSAPQSPGASEPSPPGGGASNERPVLVVETRVGAQVTGDELRSFLVGRIARWWMPDDFIFLESIPLGATGKVNKLALREMIRNR